MIGERFNYEDCFMRDLTVCVLDTLEGEVKWINRFSQGDRMVNVPFYYSLSGDERFVLDSFNDDIVSNNRFVDLNTDIIPRGHLTLTSYEIRSDEFANPNVWLKMVMDGDEEIKKFLTKVRAIPITAKYDLVIQLSSELDVFKCSQSIMDTIWPYRFMYFEHNFMNIDAVIQIPDTSQIEIQREKSFTSDNTIKITLQLDVQTYYPAYKKPNIQKNLPYNVVTENPNKTQQFKIEIFQKDLIQPIYTEYQISTSSQDGSCVLQIGMGGSVDGDLVSLVKKYINTDMDQKDNPQGESTQSSRLKIKISVDPNISDNFTELFDKTDWDVEYSESGLGLVYNNDGCDVGKKSSKSSNGDVNPNYAWSNAYTYLGPGNKHSDIILYPKMTRWYKSIKNAQSMNRVNSRQPYSSQNINNQKKI